MKKRTAGMLSAFLACLTLASACGKTADPDGTTENTTTEEIQQMEFGLFKNGSPLYGIEAEERTSLLNSQEIELMNSVSESFWGKRLTGTDRKIIMKYEGKKTDWSICFDDATGNLTFTAGEDEAMRRAVYAFLTYIGTFPEGSMPVIGPDINMSYSADTDKKDNSSLLRYIPSSEVKLVRGNASGSVMSPEWVEDMILVEIRPDIATIGGKLQDCRGLVDFYASAGVNALWLCPIYRRETGNGYGNTGPHKVDPVFTGTEDTEEGWKVVADFVSYAHSKGIYILFDVITWGVNKGSELTAAHPDWFAGESWGGDAFNWGNKELREWFISTCVDNILKTDADGFRCDCEPFTSGYGIFGEVRKRLAEKGKYIAIMSEDGCDRSKTYDFEQDGVLKYSEMTRGMYYEKPVNFFADGLLDIVDSVKNGTGLGYAEGQSVSVIRGTGKYYTNNITNHDFVKRNVNGNRLKIGYAAILAPFIPVWFMGDEFNADTKPGVQYFSTVNYADADSLLRSYFFEDVKQYIKIRRSYPDIFAYWPDNHRDSNIVAVRTDGFDKLTGYARYADGKAVLVIPSSDRLHCTGVINVPFEECGLGTDGEFTVTDMMTGREICRGTAEKIGRLCAFIPYSNVGIYMIEKK